ncbi:ribosome biogenesis GTPase Der [Desulfoluna spongiiphila]|uniref:ribosome biogenesis GTPase Der n=1 Tax=Desulfoluna spongiiphila TaxID=419481 RepID=UPI00125A96BB|nr:ribosome biogenesis GTPase Der [Desulfoluna spongiiphila]VVS94404.1 consensus disorder prediction [Desulfoluna spongiiphila]
MKPIVAIIGRPNVGKSTLFNRITRSRTALVDNMPGVTRDRHYGEALWNDAPFLVVDTGGYLIDDEDAFAGAIRDQVTQAVAEADAVVMVLDGKGGISPYDRDLVTILRESHPKVFYVVNKIDGERQEENLYDFYSLGIEHPYPVSGEHGYGVPDFLDDLVASFPEAAAYPKEDDEIINVAVVGRPNAGKSSLINRLTGQQRLVVSDVAGTTRDAVDTMMKRDGQLYRFIDTAGIRRKGKVKDKLEKFSVLKAIKSMDRCDVALILIDSSEGVTDQDVTVAGYAHDKGCGVIFVFNKWDLVPAGEKSPKLFKERLDMGAKFLSFAPFTTISALTGQRVEKIFSQIRGVYDQYNTRVSTGDVNRIIEWATERTPPPLHKGKRLKFFYNTQVAVKPPTFVSFVNYPDAVHFSYRRFLMNQVREFTELDQTPIKHIFREKTGRMEFGPKPEENTNTRNKGHKDKESRNKLQKKKERQKQKVKKLKRDGQQ